MVLYTIVYVSSARRGLTGPDIDAIVKGAREFNGSHGITGALLHHDGSFMQAIEGEESVVRPLYLRICKDPRHQSVITLMAEPIETREFADWAMGFENLSRAVLTEPAPRLIGAAAERKGYSIRLLEDFMLRQRPPLA